MKKVFLFLTLLFSCTAFSLHAEDKDRSDIALYDDYIATSAKWYGWNISIPENSFTFNSHPMGNGFSFGTAKKSGVIAGFLGGPKVQLSSKCLVVMEEHYSTSPSSVYVDKYIQDNVVRQFDGALRNNCNIAWDDAILHHGMDFSKKTKHDIAKVRRKYVINITDTNILSRTNSDQIFIVKIPNKKNIKCDYENKEDKEQIADYDECYGVAFHKIGRHSVNMLFFLKKGTDIKECLSEISNYVSFDESWANNAQS